MRKAIWVAGASLVEMAPNAHAPAERSCSSLTDIVVTPQRMGERLHDVRVGATALSGHMLERHNLSDPGKGTRAAQSAVQQIQQFSHSRHRHTRFRKISDVATDWQQFGVASTRTVGATVHLSF